MLTWASLSSLSSSIGDLLRFGRFGGLQGPFRRRAVAFRKLWCSAVRRTFFCVTVLFASAMQPWIQSLDSARPWVSIEVEVRGLTSSHMLKPCIPFFRRGRQSSGEEEDPWHRDRFAFRQGAEVGPLTPWRGPWPSGSGLTWQQCMSQAACSCLKRCPASPLGWRQSSVVYSPLAKEELH